MTDEPTPKMGRPSLYDPKFCDMVVEDMGQGYSLTAFAGLIGVNRSTITEWMNAHPDFSAAVTRGKAARLRNWEQVALSMRMNGGGPGGATITVFGLKNMGGDEWSDTQRHEVTGKDGAPLKSDMTVKVDPDTLRDAIKAVRDEY